MAYMRRKRSKTKIYAAIAVIYLLACTAILVTGVLDAGRTVETYNSSQAKLVSGLLVENVNVALDNIVAQVEEVSRAITGGRENDPDYIYDDLQLYAVRSDIYSVGYIDIEREVHGRKGDQEDLIKLDYLKKALDCTETMLTDPYRSRISAEMVLTIFVPIYKEGRRFGTVYASLPLEVLQNYANMANLNEDAAIYLINCQSLNSISCSDGAYLKAGMWNNLALRQAQMKFDNQNDFRFYVAKMQNGVKGDAISYSIDGESFTQGYERIDMMPGWYLAVELSDTTISGSFRAFQDKMVKYALMLVFLTVCLAIILVVIEIMRRRNFEELSNTDPMTGLYNKKTFTAMAEEYLENNKASAALIFVDVDDFKNYNDTYGHLNGDIVLKKFATELQKEFGEIGIVGRYGGDEFTIFIENTPQKGVVAMVMDRLRQSLADIELEEFGIVPLSFSAGGACYPQDALSFNDLCKLADDALYHVKEDGKGKFYWYR